MSPNDPNIPSERDIAAMNQPRKEAAAPLAGGVKVPKIVVKPDAPSGNGKKLPPSGPAPTQLTPEQKKASGHRFILGCAGGLLVLFIVFLILMVLVMAKGGADSPILKTFGVQGGDIKSFLLTLISAIFGFLAFVFLAIFIVGLFRVGMAKKGDKIARGRGIRLSFIGFVPLALVMMVWVGLYTFISRVQIGSEKVVAEIVALSPEDLTQLVAPVEIRFSAERVVKALQNTGAAIQAIDWDFDGDGVFESPARQPELSHIYQTVGNFRVGLRATLEGQEPKVYFFDLAIPEAVFGADPGSGTPPLAVSFDASYLVGKAKVQSLDWDFDGDGVYELEGKEHLKPQYTFDKIGDYQVHLRFVDDLNNVSNFYRTISVMESGTPNVAVVIDVTPGLSAESPAILRFDGGASRSTKGQIVRYEWDFGDGSDLSVGKTISHTFSKPGRFTVTLKVTDDIRQEASQTVDVEITAPASTPVPVIKTAPAISMGAETLSGELPFLVKFDASASEDADKDIVGYQWDFNGDGAPDAEGQKTEYTFSQAGDYNVILTVTDSQKHSQATTLTIRVDEPGVKAKIDASPVEGSMPLVVHFDASGSSAFRGKIVSYTWSFGDGTPDSTTGARISHQFDKVGTYTVKLKILTDQNQSAETTQVIFVREIPLHACFAASRKQGKAPLSVTFDSGCSSGTIARYQWNFGDGTTSEIRKGAHTFESPGTYTVKLEVLDSKNNVSTFEDTVVAEGGEIQ